MPCPRPIDWLDYQEVVNESDRARLEAHLASCPSCRTLVGSFATGKSFASRAPENWLSRINLSDAPHWNPDRDRSSFQVGDIWLTKTDYTTEAFSYELDSVVVMVVSSPWQDHGQSWLDIVPLVTETDTATPLDLTFRAEETTLGVPWTAKFRYQATVAIDQLDGAIGALVGAGQTLLVQALEGALPSERAGALLTGPDDERFLREEPLRQAIRVLAGVYATAVANAEAQEEASSKQLGVAAVIRFQPRKSSGSLFGAQKLRLAAKSSWISGKNLYEARRGSRLLSGYLKHEMFNDDVLAFVVVDVSDMATEVTITVYPRGAQAPIKSPTFVPHKGEEVVLGRGLGVVPRDVEALELHIR